MNPIDKAIKRLKESEAYNMGAGHIHLADTCRECIDIIKEIKYSSITVVASVPKDLKGKIEVKADSESPNAILILYGEEE